MKKISKLYYELEVIVKDFPSINLLHPFYADLLEIIIDINDLKRLRDSIEKMETIHQIHIFKILKENQIEFTENSNGVFINMTLISMIILLDKRLIDI